MAPSVLRPSIRNEEKLPEKKLKDHLEEQQRKDPSPKTYRHAIDVAWTEQTNKVTVHTNDDDNIYETWGSL